MSFQRFTFSNRHIGRKSKLAGMKIGEKRTFPDLTKRQLYQWVYSRKKKTGEDFEFKKTRYGMIVRRFQ